MRGCVGPADRVIRIIIIIIIGGIAVALGVSAGTLGLIPGWAYVLDAVGAIGLLTGIAGWSPLYALFGAQTCGKTG